jgi:biopolymer transport protein ExbD
VRLRTRLRRVGLPAVGLLSSLIGSLVVIPAVMIAGWERGLFYSHSVGFEVRLPNRAVHPMDTGEAVIVKVECPTEQTPPAGEPGLRLNGRPVSKDDLRASLRAELSRHAQPVVYVDGDPCLTVGNVVEVIDLARDAWYGVPIVLVTPELMNTLKVPENRRLP